MNKTSIAWTATRQPDGSMQPGYTWNPVRGCFLVSSGCKNCYAAEIAARFADTPQFEGFAKRAPSGRAYFTGKTQFMEKKLHEPLGANGGIKVFVGSMADLFHESFTDEQLDQVFRIMEKRPDITFQLLTKRPVRMLHYINSPRHDRKLGMWPLPNVWVGTSVEDQRRADERIPILTQVRAKEHFLSIEPLLGPVSLEGFLPSQDVGGGPEWIHREWRTRVERSISWVIVGAESGRFRRPMDDAWVRVLRDQCTDARVAFFFKQEGDLKSGQRPFLDGFKYEQFPGDLHPPEPYGSCPGEDITKAFPMEATVVV